MTKAYLNLPKRAMRFSSRRFPQSYRHGNEGGACYLTDAEQAELDKKEKDALLVEIRGIVTKELETRATKPEVEAVVAQIASFKDLPVTDLRAMADPKTGVMTMLVKQGEAIQKLEASLRNAPKDMSLRSQITAWRDANKEAIEAIGKGERRNLPALDIRVASPMTPATVNAGNSPYIGSVEVEAGVNDFIRAQPVFWDFLTKGRTNAETYAWVNKTNPLGAAGFIGPGIAKPGVSFALASEKSNAKKIADSAKAATELLQDIDGMETFIREELYYQVMIKVNSTLMNNAGSSTVPKGIQNYSTTYTLTTVKTTNPTMVDSIRAVVAQLRSGWLTGEITVFINSVDAANMDIAKANDSGVYLLPPFVTGDGMKVAGARIIEDNNVADGYFQAGFLRFYRILIYKDFSVAWGWENDDFTLNLVTAIGEMRLHQFVNSIYSDSGCFIYDSFNNVRNAITQEPAA